MYCAHYCSIPFLIILSCRQVFGNLINMPDQEKNLFMMIFGIHPHFDD